MDTEKVAEVESSDYATESKKKDGRGGKRDNAGRKSIHGGQTKTIRVNVELLPEIEKLQSGEFDLVTKSTKSPHPISVELRKKIDERAQKEGKSSDEVFKSLISLSLNELKDGQAGKEQQVTGRCQYVDRNSKRCPHKSSKQLHTHNLSVVVCEEHYRKLKVRGSF